MKYHCLSCGITREAEVADDLPKSDERCSHEFELCEIPPSDAQVAAWLAEAEVHTTLTDIHAYPYSVSYSFAKNCDALCREVMRLRKASEATLTRESHYIDRIQKIATAMPKWIKDGPEGWHEFSMRLKKEAEEVLAAHRKGYDAASEALEGR